MNTQSSPSSRRAKTGSSHLVSISISYEKDLLLSRGLGIEHLRELLIGLARPLLRVGTSIGYGGHWGESSDNFTKDLLRLISTEREDNSFAASTAPAIGWLYNHLAWPYYAPVTPALEAQWIHCCRILRITQQLAGIPPEQCVPDKGGTDPDLQLRNCAIVLSAMRKFATAGMTLQYPDVSESAGLKVQPQSARIILGGKITGYSGFIPGLFEELLLALEHNTPVYILGGFGGAARALADALLARDDSRQPELTLDWHKQRTPKLQELTAAAKATPLPEGVRSTEQGLDALFAKIKSARGSLADSLNTGLDDEDTEELMTTIEMRRAVQLTLSGLEKKLGGGVKLLGI